MSKVFYRKKFSDYLGQEMALLDIFAQNIPNPSPTPTPSPLPITPSITPTNTKTPTPTPTPSITPTLTRTPTVTPTNTTTPSNTPTQSITPTNTTTPSNTPTLTPTNTTTPTLTNTPTNTSTPSVTPPSYVCYYFQNEDSVQSSIFYYGIFAGSTSEVLAAGDAVQRCVDPNQFAPYYTGGVTTIGACSSATSCTDDGICEGCT